MSSLAAKISFKYSSSRNVVAFLTVVVTEWVLVLELIFFPDFDICSFISERVKKGILVRLINQPPDGYFGGDSLEILGFVSLFAACCVVSFSCKFCSGLDW